jgi:glycosyltransferase involved in cell wall biosynthesis
VPEVVEDGRTGFVVDDLDGMVDAIARVGTIDRRACRSAAESRFTVRRMVDDVEAMYRSVMDRVGAGSVGVQADRAVGV